MQFEKNLIANLHFIDICRKRSSQTTCVAMIFITIFRFLSIRASPSASSTDFGGENRTSIKATSCALDEAVRYIPFTTRSFYRWYDNKTMFAPQNRSRESNLQTNESIHHRLQRWRRERFPFFSSSCLNRCFCSWLYFSIKEKQE